MPEPDQETVSQRGWTRASKTTRPASDLTRNVLLTYIDGMDAGLVTEQRHGRERRYHFVAARLGPVRDWIAHYERFWDDHLQRLL
jgi:hypothetical protein